MRNLAPFAIGSVIRKLNHIHCQISAKHQIPFPKPEAFWLSRYVHERRYIRIHDDGRLEGGLSRFVSSLVDFSFVRSIVAHKYSLIGFAYDPVSLFLLDLFACHQKNVQQQIPASKTLSPRSGRPEVYRQSDPTGVRQK